MADLFDWSSDRYPDRPGFERGSATSEAAADSLDEDMLGRLQRRMLNYLRRCGLRGATSDEAEVALAMRHQTASARLRELELFGWAVKTDRRRFTRSGRGAFVYVIAAMAVTDERVPPF